MFLVATSAISATHDITPPTYGPAAYQVGTPIVATNGQTFLTLWTMSTYAAGTHVYGSLADTSGNVLTPISFLVAPNTTIGHVFSAGNYNYVALTSAGIVTISFDGRVIRTSPHVPAAITANGDVAFNGQRFFAVGFDYAKGQTVAMVFDLDGNIVVEAIPLTSGSVFASADVTTVGGDFIVVTSDPSGTFLWRFDANGRELRPKTLLTTDSGDLITIASAGDDVAIAWNKFAPGAPPAALISIAVASSNGTLAGRSQLSMGQVSRLTMLWNGTTYVLVGQATSGAFATRVDRAGNALDGASPVGVGVSAAAIGEVIYAAGPQAYTRPNIGASIHVDANGIHAGTTATLSNTLRRQVSPRMASDGIDSLVVWSEQTADGTTLSAIPLDRDGVRLSSPIDLGPTVRPADPAYLFNPAAHSIAFGNSVYLIVWQDGLNVKAARIDRFANVLDPQPLLLTSSGHLSYEAVAWSGSAFLVVWSSGDGKGRAVTVSEGGTISQPTPPFQEYGAAPVVAWDGHRFLVSWSEFSGIVCTCTPGVRGLSMIRLGADGAPLDPAPTFVDWPDAWTPHIATSGREFVIDIDGAAYANGTSMKNVEVRTVRADGPTLQVASPVAVFSWMNATTSDMIWDGQEYMIATDYAALQHNWLGEIRFDSTLSLQSASYSEVGAAEGYDPPAIASPSPGRVVMTMSEIATPGEVARIRMHADFEMLPMPAVPPAPLITSAVGTPKSAVVTWLIAPFEISGFIIDWSNPFIGYASPIAMVGSDARSAVVSPGSSYLRMRSFNPGGISEPTASVFVTPPPRNRAARH